MNGDPQTTAESVEPLGAPVTLKKSHVQTLASMDLLNPNNVTLPAPPGGLTWNQMVYGWAKHDVWRVNNLS